LYLFAPAKYRSSTVTWLIFLKNPNCASPELRLGSARSFSLRSRGRIKNIYDPYNVIRLIMSFLSRSTQESGLSKKKEEEEENHKAKTIEEACKTPTKNE
jgi:hypothetical protein